LQDAAKIVLRAKFIILNAYVVDEKKVLNYLSFHIKRLEKEE